MIEFNYIISINKFEVEVIPNIIIDVGTIYIKKNT